jgi:chain length determinant protein (polysaccharide antigen chain regulator)
MNFLPDSPANKMTEEDNPHSFSRSPDPDSPEGLSFVDLWQVLAGKWKLLAFSVSFSLIGAILYLFMATPLYETEVILLPPESPHVSALNIKDLNEITALEIYGEFIRNLKSISLRRQFFDQNDLGSMLATGTREPRNDDGVFRHKFHNRFRVKVGTSNEAGFVSISLRGEDPELIREMLNGFVLLAARLAINQIREGIRKQIDFEIDSLRDQIQIERSFAKELRLDRIAMLEEQIHIARELDLMTRGNTPHRNPARNNIEVAVTTADEPLYLRGIKELTAEKKILEKRENDDPFIVELREKQIRLAYLESSWKKLQASTSNIFAARIDQSASVPDNPVRPRRVLVLTESLLLGVIIGMFMAFLVNFVEQRRGT